MQLFLIIFMCSAITGQSQDELLDQKKENCYIKIIREICEKFFLNEVESCLRNVPWLTKLNDRLCITENFQKFCVKVKKGCLIFDILEYQVNTI